MLDNSDVLLKFAQDNRSFAEKLRDALHDVLLAIERHFSKEKKLSDSEKETFKELQSKVAEMERLLGEGIEGSKKTATESGGAKYSIKRTRSMSLQEQLRDYYNGKLQTSDALYFGETPEALRPAGIDTLPLAFTLSDFKKSTQTKHNVPRRVLKNLNSDLSNALFAFSDGDRIGILTDDIDADGKPLLVAIERNATMDRQNVNVIQSIYGLDNPAEWLRNQIEDGKNFSLLDEKKANAFLQTYGYSAAVGEGIRSLTGSISKENANVNEKLSRKLTNEDRRVLDELVREFGAIEAGEKPARVIQVPRRTSADKTRKVSQTIRQRPAVRVDDFARLFGLEIAVIYLDKLEQVCYTFDVSS